MVAWLGRGVRVRAFQGRRRWIILGGALVIGLLTGLSLIVGEGQVRIVSDARVEAAIPGGPVRADGSSVTPGSAGLQGEDQPPLLAYAQPFDLADQRPRIAVVVIDLGLQRQITADAMGLPRAVGLQFSPYAPDLPDQLAAARADGHEVLLGLPMEPVRFPQDDPGPHTLLAEAAPDANLDRLGWITGRAGSSIGVVGAGGRFATSPAAVPVVRELATQGLGLVEVGGRGLGQAAAAADLPYVGNGRVIDDELAPLAIDYELAALEAEALETGRALGIAQPYPITIERLQAWIDSLADKGLVLAPVSALLLDRAGLAGRLRRDGRSGSRGYG